MDFVRNQIARIQQQLNGLSASQKMLAGALVVIMLMTLYGWSIFSGRSEMDPLLTQTLSDDESMEIRKVLASSGIKYEIVGGRIVVPAEQKYDAMAVLGYAQALPRDTRSAFDEFVKSSGVFDPKSKTDALLNLARQQELSRVLRCFPNVRQATVIIDPTRQQGFNKVEPSATVSLLLRSGQRVEQKLVNAAADLVSGAVAELPRERVRVIIDGMTYRAKGLDDNSPIASGEDLLSLVQKAEQYYRDRLREDCLRHIEGAQIDVRVKANNERVEKNVHTPDLKNSVAKPLNEDTTTEETNSSPGGAGDPGLTANAPMQMGDSPAGGKNTTTNEKTRTEYKVDLAGTDMKSFNSGGDVQVTGVSVLLPRSFFVQEYRQMPGNSGKDPDDAALKPLIDDEIQRVKASVKTSLTLASDDLVYVNSYFDTAPLAGGETTTATAASVSLAVTDHVKEIALGLLAAVSLFMAASMVRKGAPSPVVEAAPPPKPSQLGGREEAVGEAQEGGAMLDGMELDEDSVKAQQMLTQVQSMVGENPDAAAAMVKRWLNR